MKQYTLPVERWDRITMPKLTYESEFVAQKSRERLKSLNNSNEDGKEESNEPDYHEDRNQSEEQEEIGELTSVTTTNEVF